MLLAGAPIAARQAQRNLARTASGVTANWMARTRQCGRRVRNGPRRACAGWVVKRHFGHSPSLLWCTCEEPSARSVASAAARFAGRGPFLTLRRCVGGNVCLAMNGNCCVGVARMNCDYLRAIVRNSCYRPNVLTLSCKNRPPYRLPRAARRLPRLTCTGGSEVQPT